MNYASRFSSMVIAVALVIAVGCGTPSFAAESKEVLSNPAVQDLMRVTTELRMDLATDAERLSKLLDNPSAGLADIIGSPLYQELPEVWEYFFTTSVALIGSAMSEEPLVAYYNPFLDSVVYVLWATDGEKLRPVNMISDAFISADKDAGKVAHWLVDGADPEALVHGYREFREHFVESYPLSSEKPAVLPSVDSPDYKRELLEARALQGLTSLTVFFHARDRSTVRNAWDTFYTAMNGDGSELDALLPADNVMSSSAITSIPQVMRQELDPAFIVTGESDSLLYQQVTTSPAFVGILGIANDPQLSVEQAIKGFAFLYLDIPPK